MGVRDDLLTIERELGASHLERRDVIRGMVQALLCRQHVVLLGPPGADKSGLSRDLTRRVSGTYFEWLLTRMSTPEELFGPISLKSLEQDSYRRITANKLPEAQIGFLDEVFKGSSAILNSLLSILNERVFHNDGQPVTIPLEMVVGASNELPEDREELGALWDRFMVRFMVDYIRDPQNFARLLGGSGQATPTMVSLADLHTAQGEVEKVVIDPVIPQVLDLRAKMREMGVSVSDRRWYGAMNVVRAEAWMNGRTQADVSDLRSLVPVLWSEPAQYAPVRKTVYSLVSPYDSAAEDLLDQAVEVYRSAIAAPDDQQTSAGVEATKALKSVARKLEAGIAEAKADFKNTQALEDALAQVQTMNAEVLKVCLKVA